MNRIVALALLAATAGAGIPAAHAVDTQMVIDVTSVNFGNVNVGNTSPAMSVTLTNSGPDSFGPINIFGGAPPTAEFNASQNCQGVTLAIGASCTVNYTFSPTSPGAFNDTSAFTISETALQSEGELFTVSLAGVGVNPVTAAPLSHDFGNVTVGTTSAPLNTVITNTSAQPFGPINIFGGAPPTAEYNASQNCQGMTLAPGGTCQINYTFSPTAPGVASDLSSFTISATASQSAGVDFSVSLTGCGVQAGAGCAFPDITVSTGSLDATLAVNQSVVKTFGIGNVGAAGLNWTIAENNGAAGCVASDIPWASILPASGSTGVGGSSTIGVTFNAAGIGPGTYQARLCINSNDPDEAQLTVALILNVTQTSIPTLSAWALAALAGMLLASAAFAVRRNARRSGGPRTRD
jgi:hypothetical protein